MGIQEFNSLVITNADGLKPFAVTLTKDRDAAQDLYQETLYKAFVHRDQYRPGTNIKAWLYTIMRNIFINEYRRQERKRMVFDTLQYFEKSSAGSHNADRTIHLNEIHSAIYKLPGIFKIACLLYFQGYKYQEIAVALNEPLGTIKSRIHFAKKMLQKKIER